MGGDRPKQYLQVAGRSILEHTLQRFLDHPALRGVVVSLAADDPYWPALAVASDPPSAEKATSVTQFFPA